VNRCDLGIPLESIKSEICTADRRWDLHRNTDRQGTWFGGPSRFTWFGGLSKLLFTADEVID